MVLACTFSAAMSALFFLAFKNEPGLSVRTGSFLRVLANCLVLSLMVRKKRKSFRFFGNREASLWLWGLFGTLAVLTFYEGIARSGVALASLFQGLSGVVLIAMGPIILKQKNSFRTWVALIGSLAGFVLIKLNSNQPTSFQGLDLCAVSGIAAGLAYLMSAKASKNNSAEVIMFYWCLFCLIAHLFLWVLTPMQWPMGVSTWIFLLVASVLASLSQYFTTVAYALTPAAPVASLGYLTPVLGLAIDLLIFRIPHGVTELVGSMVVIVFGVWLPFLGADSVKK